MKKIVGAVGLAAVGLGVGACSSGEESKAPPTTAEKPVAAFRKCVAELAHFGFEEGNILFWPPRGKTRRGEATFYRMEKTGPGRTKHAVLEMEFSKNKKGGEIQVITGTILDFDKNPNHKGLPESFPDVNKHVKAAIHTCDERFLDAEDVPWSCTFGALGTEARLNERGPTITPLRFYPREAERVFNVVSKNSGAENGGNGVTRYRINYEVGVPATKEENKKYPLVIKLKKIGVHESQFAANIRPPALVGIADMLKKPGAKNLSAEVVAALGILWGCAEPHVRRAAESPSP